ncbi:hypothetical protein San01_26930 [Streptomyces angustmyceticus]|uniref:Uncharacterized protein n=1 Tax=Streptomyces angustmyceticus TaxID=285578 RepID=A0A5J4LFJ3_9ACTN|nr:hypothetical protein San01_26930 [Streptomyces angustmyceticus]
MRPFAEHAVADLDPVDALTDLVHHPGGVQPDPGRQRDRMGRQDLAFADPPVDGVHARRPDGDAYVSGARVGLLGIFESENVRTAELGEAHSLHAVNVTLTVSVLELFCFCS